jgi:signal transduction histidine kinase
VDMSKPAAFWVGVEESAHFILILPSRPESDEVNVFVLSAPKLQKLVRELRPMNGEASAPYARAMVEIAGRVLFPAMPGEPLLATAPAALFSGMPRTVMVAQYLARPDLLYVQAQLRTKWVAALILASAVAALAGFVAAYRGFHQQRRLSEMKSNFVSSVSHELRAPIASVSLLAEVLDPDKMSDPKQRECHALMLQQLRQLSFLTENILDFSRIEQRRNVYEFEPVNIYLLVDQTVQLLEPCAAERQVHLEVRRNGAPVPPSFACDSLAIRQALTNLIDNAIKHTPDGGIVRIDVQGSDRYVSLSIADQGTGIPADEQGKIFERFYRRGSELRRETRGIGIGLAIVKEVIEGHGGRIVVQSAVGKGSCFVMELPIDRPRG